VSSTARESPRFAIVSSQPHCTNAEAPYQLNEFSMLSLVSAEVSIRAPAHRTAVRRQSKSSCSLSKLLSLDPLKSFLAPFPWAIEADLYEDGDSSAGGMPYACEGDLNLIQRAHQCLL
jgi:hypothetical protein